MVAVHCQVAEEKKEETTEIRAMTRKLCSLD